MLESQFGSIAWDTIVAQGRYMPWQNHKPRRVMTIYGHGDHQAVAQYSECMNKENIKSAALTRNGLAKIYLPIRVSIIQSANFIGLD